MSEYVPTIGLEIHAELKTRTKMFCSSRNDPDESHPNVNICPVCLAHPGTLPVINKEAVRHVLRVGLALGGKLADYTEFDRKNYFYPDLPKGYQLSQYEYPLVSGGELDGIKLTRVHLEEDTARSMHDEALGTTTIDYNRAGVPLMELVTEPVITSAEQAGKFARELQLLLRYLGVSEANMEKGEMRVEANVSIQTIDNREKRKALGTKVEIKNLNSFNAMERAVRYEIARQTKLLQEGKEVRQETRGWDESKQATFPQRLKEGGADYRYFPDPDLPSLQLSEIPELKVDALAVSMPELPRIRRARYSEMGVKEQDTRLLAAQPALSHFFDAVCAHMPPEVTPQLAANYITNDLAKLIRDSIKRDTDYIDDIGMSPSNMSAILRMIASRKISSRVAKDLLEEVFRTNKDPSQIVGERGLQMQAGEKDVAALVERILKEHDGVVRDYRAGKMAAMEYLVGQGMKTLRGTGDPETIRRVILEKI